MLKNSVVRIILFILKLKSWKSNKLKEFYLSFKPIPKPNMAATKAR